VTILGSLNGNEVRSTITAIEIMRNMTDDSRKRKYKLFLSDVGASNPQLAF
jgi:hypothetical protein